jgi:mannose-6-phosphate isomerase-like protein (cupin superfamily)
MTVLAPDASRTGATADSGIFTIEKPNVATDNATPGKRVVVSKGNAPHFIPGRRSWVRYRELGVTEATNGEMRAQVLHAGTANESTGWHLHRCDMQFLYCIDGAITIAFSPDHIVRLEAGDSMMIPGGTIHIEPGAPEGVEILEISIPADMGTESVPNPYGDVQIDFSKAGTVTAR